MNGVRELDRERRHDPRAELHVDLVYDSFSSFLSVAAGNLSRGGMFLAVPKPASAGTRLSFEARLSDGSSLIRGEGEVVWTRTEVTAGLPTGMAIRFTRLSAQARDVIARLLEQYPDGRSGSVRLGGVRLGKARGPVEAAPGPVERSLPLGEVTDPEPEPARQVGSGGRPSALPPRPPVRVTTTPAHHPPDVRATDEVGSEFDFTLPPWEAEPIPAELRPPNPVRNILTVLALLCVALVAISVGPSNLVGMAGHIGSAVIRRLLPEPSATPAPVVVRQLDSGAATPTPGLAPSATSAPAQAGDTSEQPTLLTVDRVAWRRGAGGVVVTVDADRDIDPQSVHYSQLSEPPRHVVRIVGVDSYRGRTTLEVRRSDLVRIRVGLHGDRSPGELDIVLDLGSRPVTVEPLGVHGGRLELVVRPG